MIFDKQTKFFNFFPHWWKAFRENLVDQVEKLTSLREEKLVLGESQTRNLAFSGYHVQQVFPLLLEKL